MTKQEMVRRYLAYTAYRTQLQSLQGYAKQRDAARAALLPNGRFEAVHKICEIHTDWIDAIEGTLDNIRSAINEQRQFIRREGSVVPIEKARHVSKESTIHLAKHSELLSGSTVDTITPEKIYIKENQSNFLVYENKFLYMALCYLRDFVDIRYAGIQREDNTYTLHMTTDAVYSTKEKKSTFVLDYREASADSAYKTLSEQNVPIVERIQGIRFAISSYLNTELMIELSKAPMLQPPVTPTNVLRMDHDFRAVYQLYTTIVSYPDRGYTVHEKKLCLDPLPTNVADDLAELMLLCSFLSNLHGGESEEAYKAILEQEAFEARKQALLEQTARIAALRTQFDRESDYLAALEQYALSLEAQREDWLAIAQRNETLQHALTVAGKSQKALQKTCDDAQTACETLQRENHAAVERVKEEGRQMLCAQEQRFSEEMEAQKRIHTEEADALHREMDALQHTLAEKDAALLALTEQTQILTAKLRIADAGALPDTDFTDEEAFNALEREKRAYDRYFEKAWKQARAQIRREHLWNRPKKNRTHRKTETEDTHD